MVANVSKTLATAADVLEHLHQALLRGGFAGGVPAYRAMTDLLFGQRAWSLSRADDPLAAQFQKVAAKAAAVRDILEPYTEMMRRLSAVAALELPAAPEVGPAPKPEPEALQERIVAALRAHGRPMTATALAREAGLTRTRARAAIRELVAGGAVEAAQAGRRTFYSLRGMKDQRHRSGSEQHSRLPAGRPEVCSATSSSTPSTRPSRPGTARSAP
jgi:DNA-binding transcriptional ArsR family regulator